MHAFTHSLTHRAPSATRPRVRWQPYTSISSQSSSSGSCNTKSPSSQLSTPSTSISSPSNTPLPEPKPSTHPQNSKETTLPRDSTKKQFAAGLVDQTVKTLSEIWRPQDIPAAFITSRSGITIGANLESQSGNNAPLACHRMAGSTAQVSPPSSASDLRGSLAPIKGFVHEVLRRSRTSGCVLQTALCYLEAIRPRVPDLLQKEQAGLGVRGETDISSRITPATELELKLEEDAVKFEMAHPDEMVPQDDLASTVRVMDITTTTTSSFGEVSKTQETPIIASTATPGALPSPLLCPRRTFLASLILASKFTQDKCYSNRAWAKLSGLPPREIGRCERALGEALEWRLWVGKAPVAQPSQPSAATPVSVPAGRPVVRSQSESNILNLPSTRSPFLVRSDARAPSMASSGQRMLHRCPTVPVEMFSSASPPGRTGLSQPYRMSQEQLPSLAGAPPQFTMFTETLSQSPSPDNPGLSYSPSSTESSSGDRTIQMSSFIDEPMATYSASQAPAATEFWPYTDNCDAPQDIRISPVGFMKQNRAVKAPVVSENIGVFGFPSGIIANGEQFIPTGYISSNPTWLVEGECLRPLSLATE